MDDLCDALDKTVQDIFQVLEDLYDAKAKLEQAMKDGYFQMARSRYSIGVKRVDADQILNADISCTHSVRVSENPEDTLNHADADNTQSQSDLKIFELICPQNASKESRKDSNKKDINEDKEDNKTELRKRALNKENKTKADDAVEAEATDSMSKLSLSQSEISEKENKGSKFVLKDPINLFGVLVPQSLRSSQQNFKTAVSLSVEIANLQYQLSFFQKKYSQLKEKKKNFIVEKEA